ncbi:MAG: hypothetical protein CSA65_07140 [Proteobacteria bacterium]|nr:MAG: hypothetical protein CSB49_06565 [Pseudomonadota bacterium]PIE17922.1 MAG: hypothetical protein CSA65_07140 [Pseudomonadota bacterium]
MGRLRGWKTLVTDGVDEITRLVQRTHHVVAERQLRRLEHVPEVAEVARAVDSAHRAIADLVYGSILAVNRGVEAATELALDALPAPTTSDDPSTRREGARPWLVDAAQSALNGAFGDYLRERGNELDLGMTLHAAIAAPPLPEVTAEALAEHVPEATSRLVLFVHGLATNECSWRFGVDRYVEGDGDGEGEPPGRGQTFAERLAPHGFTSLYLRYNTGRHISESGAQLAELLEVLVERYPLELEQLALVGHSMGGLVCRSAAHQANERGLHWVERLDQLVCIGSPHHGAPLEKLANVAVNLLGRIDTAGTQVPAEVIAARSDGIKDLRFGYTQDKEWRDLDPEALLRDYREDVPYLEHVATCFIGATITRDPEHPMGKLLGDLLVRLPSSTPAPDGSTSRRTPFELSTLGGLGHLDLLTHPDVYAQLEGLFTSGLPRCR